jgi:hypothetical protein
VRVCACVYVWFLRVRVRVVCSQSKYTTHTSARAHHTTRVHKVTRYQIIDSISDIFH